MTSVLSLAASSPLPEAHRHHTFERSGSSCGSAATTGTVQHHPIRRLSGSSLSSLTSLWAPPFRRPDNASKLSSTHDLSLRRCTTSLDRRSTSGSNSRRTSFVSLLSSRLRSEPALSAEHNETRLRDVAESDSELPDVSGEEMKPPRDRHVEEEDVRIDPVPALIPSLDLVERTELNTVEGSPKSPGLRRWLSTLRRRKQQVQGHLTPPIQKWKLGNLGSSPTSPVRRRFPNHKHSDSRSSSAGFVTAVRSATVTIASASIATVSRGNARWRRGHQRSSLISGSDPRPSVDSQRSAIDEAAKQRSRKRRDKLEELIGTEESYVADMKALSKAYSTILSHQPTSASFARSSTQQNISAILALHDDILSRLHGAVPFAEFDQRTAKTLPKLGGRMTHTRWHSVDVVPTSSPTLRSKLASIRQGRRSLNINRSSDEDSLVFRCSPQVIAAVTKIYSQYMHRFSVYEEYGMNFELVQRDVDETRRATTSWPEYDRAIEALSIHVNSVRSREENKKKAMTIKDLLIKPIQRLPRYELLFIDLCKLTPVCDDPDSHARIQELLEELNDTCMRMNAAKDDPVRSRMLEATWTLGDRLTFSNQVPRSVYLQLLGKVHMCGCLHIAYRSKDRVKGLYIICVLFESTLLLASADDDPLRYSTLAGVPLANATIVEADNGKGLQCYTAPHSWKLVFEYSARMYEIILTACSAIEAAVWRQQLIERIEGQSQAVAAGSSNVFELHSPLTTEMRSVGKAFGKPGSFIRRMSVHRTATVGPTSELNQVIIKNTLATKEAVDNSSQTSVTIPRSQSVATPSHVQTISPHRQERIRLEGLLVDVWTKDLLPYPGMLARRSDEIRASANIVMRKFSMASIASNFSSSKRSASYTSINHSRKEDMPPPKSKSSTRDRRAYSKPARPPLVDFHNAPEAFLPADFGLGDPTAKRKKSAFRTFTMTMERPFSPLLGNEPKPSGVRRTQSTRNVREEPSVSPPKRNEEKPAIPVYSVVQERAKTPGKPQTPQPSDETTASSYTAPAKAPRKSKSKSKLLRLFG